MAEKGNSVGNRAPRTLSITWTTRWSSVTGGEEEGPGTGNAVERGVGERSVELWMLGQWLGVKGYAHSLGRASLQGHHRLPQSFLGDQELDTRVL